MQAFEKFDLEMTKLESLHAATLYAYDETIQRTKERIKQKFLKPDEAITRTMDPSNNITVAANPGSLRQRLRVHFAPQLSEVLFVRAISVLEVFLVDTVRELFVGRQDLFHRQENESLSYGRLLSFRSVSEIATHIINQECRRLQNKGFGHIITYFAKQFDIHLDDAEVDLGTLRQYHDKRHLLVHRLGKTDAKYRKDYGTTEQKITVDKRYLMDAFAALRKLALYVRAHAEELIEDADYIDAPNPYQMHGAVVVTPLTQRGKRALSESCAFSCDDDVLSVRDILVSTTRGDKGALKLNLQATSKQMRAYVGHLRRLEAGRHLEVNEAQIQPDRSPAALQVPVALAERIREFLPPQPWPIGIHREIAAQFGISNSQAHRLLSQFLVDPLGD